MPQCCDDFSFDMKSLWLLWGVLFLFFIFSSLLRKLWNICALHQPPNVICQMSVRDLFHSWLFGLKTAVIEIWLELCSSHSTSYPDSPGFRWGFLRGEQEQMPSRHGSTNRSCGKPDNICFQPRVCQRPSSNQHWGTSMRTSLECYIG